MTMIRSSSLRTSRISRPTIRSTLHPSTWFPIGRIGATSCGARSPRNAMCRRRASGGSRSSHGKPMCTRADESARTCAGDLRRVDVVHPRQTRPWHQEQHSGEALRLVRPQLSHLAPYLLSDAHVEHLSSGAGRRRNIPGVPTESLLAVRGRCVDWITKVARVEFQNESHSEGRTIAFLSQRGAVE